MLQRKDRAIHFVCATDVTYILNINESRGREVACGRNPADHAFY